MKRRLDFIQLPNIFTPFEYTNSRKSRNIEKVTKRCKVYIILLAKW